MQPWLWQFARNGVIFRSAHSTAIWGNSKALKSSDLECHYNRE